VEKEVIRLAFSCFLLFLRVTCLEFLRITGMGCVSRPLRLMEPTDSESSLMSNMLVLRWSALHATQWDGSTSASHSCLDGVWYTETRLCTASVKSQKQAPRVKLRSLVQSTYIYSHHCQLDKSLTPRQLSTVQSVDMFLIFQNSTRSLWIVDST
jgi:hypothetical protein